jgi:hypothetical protein
MPRLISFLTAVVAACGFAISVRAAPAPAPNPPAPETQPRVEMNDLEKQFEQQMSGATLVGRFSVDGREDQHPKEDRYVITKVTKIGNDLWIFSARIGNGKLPIPIPVPVKWAGDTPVISVTKLSIPRGGTYTARVVIYGGRYAGTWDAGDHGGQMWGRVERPASTTKKASEKPSDKP